jgi:uncharacterized protein YbjT (DUF2867 family)
VESAVEASGLEHAIVRCSWIYGRGSPLLASLRSSGRIEGLAPGLRTGRQTVAPVFAGDVAAVLAAADDRADLRSGTWRLGGPDRLTVDAFASLVTGSPRRPVRRRPWRRGNEPDEGQLDLGEDDRELPDAAAEFAVALTPLTEGLARSQGSKPGE